MATKKKSSTTKTKVTKSKVTNKAPVKKKSIQAKRRETLIAGIIVLLLALFAIFFGIPITLILVAGIGLILLFAKLLKKSKASKAQRTLLNGIIITFLSVGIIGSVAASLFIVYIVITANPLFEVSKLYTKEASIFYDINGQEYAKVGAQMREKVSYDELPQVLIDAIVATEDSRYFQHNGFDAPRFLVASAGQATGNSDAGGASTITMQVIKNSFTSSEDDGLSGIIRKFQDIYLAIFKLEQNYTKEEIFEYYVNNHYLGGTAWGVEQASQENFGKSATELNLAEASIIAGLFKSPNYYSPSAYPENAEERQNTVLYLMERHGYITEEEMEIAAAIPVTSLLKTENTSTSNQYQDYIDAVTKELDEKYGVNPYTTPLLVYTNLDPAMQTEIDKIQSGETFAWKDDVIQTGIAVLDNDTGQLLAVGAGRNRPEGVNQFSYATDMNRQPGSTAKPLFDYGPAIEYNNMSTYTLFDDEPYTYSTGQNLNNWDGRYMGTLTMRKSLALSRNVPALKAFQAVDNAKIVEFATGLGLTPEIENGRVHEAHAIGAYTGSNPVQLAAAYAAFGNNGYYNEPYSVSKIVYRDTEETMVYEVTPTKAMSDSTAYMITDILRDVLIDGYTINNFAVKTGTTNFDAATIAARGLSADAIRDSWAVGYSTNTTIAMWYGYDTATQEYHNRTLEATVAKDRLYRTIVNNVIGTNLSDFTMPSSVIEVGIENGTNPPQIAGPNTPEDHIIYELFKKGTEPTETSDRYDATQLSTPTNLKVTHSNDNVTLSWSPVSASASVTFGSLGYNVYHNDVHLGFVTNTSYTITNPANPYGTYKVIASYQTASGKESAPATYVLQDPSIPTDNISSTLTIPSSASIKIGGSYNIITGSNAVSVKNNGTDVTSSATITHKITNAAGLSTTIDYSKEGIYNIIYTVTYKTYTKEHKVTITIE